METSFASLADFARDASPRSAATISVRFTAPLPDPAIPSETVFCFTSTSALTVQQS